MTTSWVKPELSLGRSASVKPEKSCKARFLRCWASILKTSLCSISLFVLLGCALTGCSRVDTGNWDLMGQRDAKEFTRAEVDDLSQKAEEIREAMIRTKKQNELEKIRSAQRATTPEADPSLEQIRLWKDMYETTEDEHLRRMIVEKLLSIGPNESNNQSKSTNQTTKTTTAEPQLAESPTNKNIDNRRAPQAPATHIQPDNQGSKEYRIADFDANHRRIEPARQDVNLAIENQHTDRRSVTNVGKAMPGDSSSARVVLDQNTFRDPNLRQAGFESQQTTGQQNDGYPTGDANARLSPNASITPNSHMQIDGDHRPIELGDWKRKLIETVSLLEQTKKEKHLTDSEQAYLDLSLRFLNLIQGNHDKAVEAIEGLSLAEQEYWREQIFAMSRIVVDPVDDSSNVFVGKGKQAFRALEHLRTATSHLASIAALDVKNLHWCSRIDDFGQFTEVSNKTFAVGSPQLVYCELENWSIEESATAEGARFVSKIQPSYVILDENREVVKQHQYAMLTDTSRNQRRDFHLTLPITIPKLPPGTYYLQLVIDDVVGDKAANSKIPLTFRIQ